MFPSCLPTAASSRKPEKVLGREPVILNVYDMYWVNSYTANLGLGVFHSGVEVHGEEFVYGGHPFSFTGIFPITPRDPTELGDQFRFRQSINVGWTDFTPEEVRSAVTELGKQFKGDKYHLMNNNCNHFSGALCQLLCGNDIPPWVNRLAYFSSCVPFLQRCLPREWLTPVALQQSLAAHGNTEESTESTSH
ncbi:deubiquitinase DESI2 [Arctopsyche grandis]|uniref:deubiquitinase DESI2 n=1 Tax=Arctopsyche grandis TaxID=121162 RepID=UPI00406D9597